jgi:hypothetical protein
MTSQKRIRIPNENSEQFIPVMTNSGDFSFGEEGSNYESHEKDSQIFDKFNEEY